MKQFKCHLGGWSYAANLQHIARDALQQARAGCPLFPRQQPPGSQLGFQSTALAQEALPPAPKPPSIPAEKPARVSSWFRLAVNTGERAGGRCFGG